MPLSDLFRYSINYSNNNYTTVKDEVEMANVYLQIEKIRFEDQLNYSLKVEEELNHYLVPRFFRIQKSYIINKDRIKEMHRHFNSRYLFIMDDKSATRLTSGRTYHDAIREEFGL